MEGNYIAAVIGGACAGSEIAHGLAEQGMEVIVIEQNDLPYGKIEDGLPRWHHKLQQKEMKSIDARMAHPRIHFVPRCRVGDHLQVNTLFEDWKLPLAVLATGAWRDRPMRVDGVESVTDDSFIYQNPLVYWFNHYHEPNFNAKTYHIPEGAAVIGGGLASIDVAKICMFETVKAAMKERGFDVDITEMEHRGINHALEKHGLDLDRLGVKPARLFYRKRVIDMPLVPMPENPLPQKLEKAKAVREKIVANCRKRYGFEVVELHAPETIHTENGSVTSVTFRKNTYADGRFVDTGERETIETPLVISSIGSIPEPIPGLSMEGELFKWDSRHTGAVSGQPGLYCVGNAITGRGNIKDSAKNARRLNTLIGAGLENDELEYEALFESRVEEARAHVGELIKFLKSMPATNQSERTQILEKVKALQSERGYQGYDAWKEQILTAR